MKLTQKNFNQFLETQRVFAEALNHRMTHVENDVKWIKKLGYYMSSILTLIFIAILQGVF